MELQFFENQIYHTKTSVSEDYIYSEAVENILDFDKIIEIKKSESLNKVNGIPYYTVDNQMFSASKTQHGKYEKAVYLNKVNPKFF